MKIPQKEPNDETKQILGLLMFVTGMVFFLWIVSKYIPVIKEDPPPISRMELYESPLTIPMEPITSEEFRKFQELNGLSSEKDGLIDENELDNPEKGTILNVEGDETPTDL
jgi:hypothetical protein